MREKLIYDALRRTAWLAPLFIAIISTLSLPRHASGDVRAMALIGDTVTGSPGQVYTGFDPPALNDRGQIAFTGRLSNGLSGVFRSRGFGTEVVATENMLVPGSVELFKGFSSPLLNDAGEVAFFGTQTIGGVTQPDSVVVLSDGSGLSLIAQRGSTPPAEDLGTEFFGFRSLRFNNLGQVAFNATLSGSNAGPGLYAYQNGLRQVVREGAVPAGAIPDGVGAFLNVDWIRATLNSTGDIAFVGSFEVPPESGFHPSSGIAVFKETNGNLVTIARRLDQPPESNAGASFSQFNLPSISRGGEVAFEARASLGAGGLYASSTNGDLSPVGPRTNEVSSIAGTEYQFGGFIEFEASNESVLINPNGLTAFASFLIADTEEGRQGFHGVFTAGPDGMTLAALTGDAAPGLASGTTLSDFFMGGNSFTMALNGQDQVAFTATVEDSQGAESRALFATDQQGGLQLIVGAGQLLNVGNNPFVPDLREVVSFEFVDSSGDDDGRRSAFNDRGQIAFSASFTDGTSGVFVSNAVALPSIPGDYNDDGVVDAADYTVWRNNLGAAAGTLPNDIDGGEISTAHFETWRSNYGSTLFSSPAAPLTDSNAVPEPNAFTVLFTSLACFVAQRRRNR